MAPKGRGMKNYGLHLLAGVALLVSCTGQPSSVTAPGTNANLAVAVQFLHSGLPPVPPDRVVDAVFNAELNGIETHDRSLNAVAEGDALQLISGSNSLSWGVWRFSPRMAALTSVEVVMTVPDGEQAYIGLAEYDRNAWHFSEPVTAGATLNLSDAKHKSLFGACCVAVVTTGGDTATVYKLVLHTESDWQIVTVDKQSEAKAGHFTSLINVQSRPAICYGVFGSGSVEPSLNYVRAEDATGSTWGEPITISSGWRCMFICAAIAGTVYPSVCWNQEGISDTSELWFAYALDSTGTTWTSPYRVDGMPHDGADIGFYASMAVKDGNPAISYFNTDFSNLKLAQCNFSSHTWSSDYVANGNYLWTSLVFDADGKPVITFIDDDSDHLMIVGRNGADTGWNPPLPIDAEGSFCNTVTAKLVGPNVGVAYCELNSCDLRYAYYDVQHEQWERLVVDDLEYPCGYASLAIIDGKPAVSYCDFGTSRLKYVRALDALGSSWGDPEVVDSIGNTGYYSSLAEIDGKPAISYQESASGSLKFAILLEP